MWNLVRVRLNRHNPDGFPEAADLAILGGFIDSVAAVCGAFGAPDIHVRLRLDLSPPDGLVAGR